VHVIHQQGKVRKKRDKRGPKLDSSTFGSRTLFVGWKPALCKRKSLLVTIKVASNTANVNHSKNQAASEKKFARYASSAL
jgi:hypothetical protein